MGEMTVVTHLQFGSKCPILNLFGLSLDLISSLKYSPDNTTFV